MSPVLQGVCWLVLTLVGVLGIRLLGLSARSRSLPEALVGVFFLAAAAVGYAPLLLVMSDPTMPAEQASLLRKISLYGLAIPPAALALFVWRVFRPGSSWAAAAAIGISAVSLLGAVMTAGIEVAPGESLPAGRFIALLTRATCYGWGAWEAGSRWRMGLRRLKVGLADPVVVNRFLLWTVWCGSTLLISMANLTTGVIGRPDAGSFHELTLTLVHLVAGSGCALASWLTFVPPRLYLERVARRPAPAES